MGGRVAEKLFSIRERVLNDFRQATQMARAMVTEYGMVEKLGPVQYEIMQCLVLKAPQKMISEQTAYEIDEKFVVVE